MKKALFAWIISSTLCEKVRDIVTMRIERRQRRLQVSSLTTSHSEDNHRELKPVADLYRITFAAVCISADTTLSLKGQTTPSYSAYKCVYAVLDEHSLPNGSQGDGGAASDATHRVRSRRRFDGRCDRQRRHAADALQLCPVIPESSYGRD